jgi:hypothetical protein
MDTELRSVQKNAEYNTKKKQPIIAVTDAVTWIKATILMLVLVL